MERIGVDCRLDQWTRAGAPDPHGETWHTVAQGRQWQDTSGRHVLVMLAGERIEELLLSAEDLTWRLVMRPRQTIL